MTLTPHMKAQATALRDEPKLARLLSVLDGAGEETRIVGGALRNALLGQHVSEIDLATTALPQVVEERCKAAGLRTIPTGIDHGTITVLVDGTPFEVTTLREDVETDGRRAVVRFGRDFSHDAIRRDFTINALSLSADGTIHDYVGGLDDLIAKRVRFIGVARERIREDYLRSLRFFRFHAAYADGPLDAEGFAAIIVEREGLRTLSRERIRAELMKLLITRRAADVVEAMSQAGIFAHLLKTIIYPARLFKVMAIEAARNTPANALLRLAAICVAIPDDASALRDDLRLSNAEQTQLQNVGAILASLHAHPALDAAALKTLLFRHHRAAVCDALTLAHAISGPAPDDSDWMKAWDYLATAPVPKFPFSGADLMAKGLKSGRGLGDALKGLEETWIAAGFPDDPAHCEALLASAIAPLTIRA